MLIGVCLCVVCVCGSFFLSRVLEVCLGLCVFVFFDPESREWQRLDLGGLIGILKAVGQGFRLSKGLSSGFVCFDDHCRSKVSVNRRWGTWCNNVRLG